MHGGELDPHEAITQSEEHGDQPGPSPEPRLRPAGCVSGRLALVQIQPSRILLDGGKDIESHLAGRPDVPQQLRATVESAVAYGKRPFE
jgi:hypothetical protein